VRQTSIQQFGRRRFIGDQDLAKASQQAGANNGNLVLASGGENPMPDLKYVVDRRIDRPLHQRVVKRLA
jgi:hypothetical protein